MSSLFEYSILLCILLHGTVQSPTNEYYHKDEATLKVVKAIPVPQMAFRESVPNLLEEELLKSNIFTEREGLVILDDLDTCSTVILEFKEWTNGAVVASVMERIKHKMNFTIDDADLVDSIKRNFKHLSITSFEESTKGLVDVNSGERLEFVSALIFGLGIFSGLVFGKVEALVENFLSQKTQNADLNAIHKLLNATLDQQKRNRLEAAYSLASYALQREFEDMLSSILRFNAPSTLLLRDGRFTNGLQQLMGAAYNSSVLKNHFLSYGNAIKIVPIAVDARRSALITEICYPKSSTTYELYKAYSLGGFEADKFVYKDIPSHVIGVDDTFYPVSKSDCIGSIYGLYICARKVLNNRVSESRDIELAVSTNDFLFVRPTRSGYLIATTMPSGILKDGRNLQRVHFSRNVTHLMVPSGMSFNIGNRTLQCRQADVAISYDRKEFPYNPQPSPSLPSFVERSEHHLSSGALVLLILLAVAAIAVFIKKDWAWKKAADDRVQKLEILLRSSMVAGTLDENFL